MDAFDWRKDFLERVEAEIAGVIADGHSKFSAGLKPIWYQDPTHLPAIFSHLNRYFKGEKRDPDSGHHPMIHLGVRAFMIGLQQTGNYPNATSPLHTLD